MTDNPYSDQEPVSDTPTKRPIITLNKVFSVLGIVLLLFALLLPALRRRAGPETHRVMCKNHFKQIALALLNYKDLHNSWPPAYTVDENGKPLHSWRTLILPYMGENRVYEMIDLSKPWNDPANAEAYQTKVPAFQCPATILPANDTTYLAVVTSNSLFRPNKSARDSEVTRDPADILIEIEVPADRAVHWMSPMDADEKLIMSFDSNSKLAHSQGVHALFADGSVRVLDPKTPAAERRAMISISGNDE